MTDIQHPFGPGKPRAIETAYKGYKFRSRLEARYAVFFETLGLDWTYEPEGFDLGGVWYLPDFKVKTPQGADIWYEIKPRGITEDGKFSRFVASFGHEPDRASLLHGDPVDLVRGADFCPRCGLITPRPDGKPQMYDMGNGEMYIHCWHCDMETPCGGGHPEVPGFLGMPYYPHKGDMHVGKEVIYTAVLCWIAPAAIRARKARFEHGAKP